MEVGSWDNGLDRVHLIVVGACLVRLVNRIRSEKGLPKDFVLAVIYMDCRAEDAERCLLYQPIHGSEVSTRQVSLFNRLLISHRLNMSPEDFQYPVKTNGVNPHNNYIISPTELPLMVI